MEYTEYSKTRNLQNILYLIWTALKKKAEVENTRLFWNIKNALFSYYRKPYYRLYDGFWKPSWRVSGLVSRESNVG